MSSFAGGWEYANHPNRKVVLQFRTQLPLNQLLSEETKARQFLNDTRPAHGAMFAPLTPPGHEYFAGNYRGASLGMLATYDVQIGSSKGASYFEVGALMGAFHVVLVWALHEGIPPRPTDEASFDTCIDFACRAFSRFLQIHPYANGNGHIARLLLTVLLEQVGLRVVRGMSIEPRPGYPYDECIAEYMAGNPYPLMRHVADCVG